MSKVLLDTIAIPPLGEHLKIKKHCLSPAPQQQELQALQKDLEASCQVYRRLLLQTDELVQAHLLELSVQAQTSMEAENTQPVLNQEGMDFAKRAEEAKKQLQRALAELELLYAQTVSEKISY